MADPTVIAAYSVPLVSILSAYMLLRRRNEASSRAQLADNIEAGLAEPSTLHPKIDPRLCLGCGACTKACPEGSILGLIAGKATLIEPSSCIGHGACAAACPHGAIELVFGTETRGIELPHVGPDFQTNIPGLYIAGELGGMGLVRNAIEQGRQAVQAITKSRARGATGQLDLVIVGAGPAGLSAALAAIEAGLSYVVLEQDRLGGAIAHFPRGKLVMTKPAELPIVGKFKFHEVSKEELMRFWHDVVAQTGIAVRCGEPVSAIRQINGGGFEVDTPAGRYAARAVLLAIGRRGTPRRLGVPGEELAKVVYGLEDPAAYDGRAVLVVGGGDSALEAAASLAENSTATVWLSYRGTGFARAKGKNRERIASATKSGRIKLVLESEVKAIAPDRVALEQARRTIVLPNTDVVVCAGGILPTGFLKGLGIRIETKYGTA